MNTKAEKPLDTAGEIRHSIAVSVVIPVYRNEDTLVELQDRLNTVLEKLAPSWEIIFVNDASPDSSLEVLRRMAMQSEVVSVLSHGINIGQQSAVMAGISVARGDRIVVMDADLQDRPEDLASLFEEMEKGYSIVFGGRSGQFQAIERHVTSFVFKRLISWIARVPPNAGMFLALDRLAVDNILTFHAPKPYLVAMAGLTGLPLSAVTVRRGRRAKGVSAYTALRRLRVGYSAIGWTLMWRFIPRLRQTGNRAAFIPVEEVIGSGLKENNKLLSKDYS